MVPCPIGGRFIDLRILVQVLRILITEPRGVFSHQRDLIVIGGRYQQYCMIGGVITLQKITPPPYAFRLQLFITALLAGLLFGAAAVSIIDYHNIQVTVVLGGNFLRHALKIFKVIVGENKTGAVNNCMLRI